MTKFITKRNQKHLLLSLFIISITFFKCSDDDATQIPVFTLTTNGVPDNIEQFVILTDTQGGLIDSSNVSQSGTIEFLGSELIKHFNYTFISVSETDLNVTTTYDIPVGIVSLPPSSQQSLNRESVSIEVDPEIQNIVVATPVSFAFRSSFGSTLQETIDFVPEKFIYAAKSGLTSSPPQYTIYTDVVPNSSFKIREDDFMDMTFQPVNFGYDKEKTRGFFMDGFENDSSDPRYLIDLNSINRLDFAIAPEGIYYPGDVFGSYTTIVSYDLETGKRGSNIFREIIPSEIIPLSLDDISIIKDLVNYQATATGNFDQVRSRWSNVSAGDLINPGDLTISWSIIGQNTTNYSVSTLKEVIQNRYSEFDLSSLNYQQTVFSNEEELSYDEIVRGNLGGNSIEFKISSESKSITIGN